MEKHFTHKEITELKEKKNINDIDVLTPSVASRFAAKEAVAKALGTGFRDGITLKDIEIIHDKLGKPLVNLHDKALFKCQEIAKNQRYTVHITISNEKEYANSVAVIEV
jgi:holo-[acyl-carrier protein] synthase